MNAPSSPTVTSLLEVLTKDRLVDLGRRFEVAVRSSDTKAEQLESLQRAPALDVAALIPTLGRDELRAACRRLGLADTGRSRAELANRLIAKLGDDLAEPFTPAFATAADRPYSPQPGDVVLVRHRQYLVEEVVPPALPRQQTLVRLTCLDDDAQGRSLEVLWELELGARVLAPEASGLGQVGSLDEPLGEVGVSRLEPPNHQASGGAGRSRRHHKSPHVNYRFSWCYLGARVAAARRPALPERRRATPVARAEGGHRPAPTTTASPTATLFGNATTQHALPSTNTATAMAWK
ncbi:MAG TPA: hypothetical protein VNB06_09225, partial [Thermoanaerobaculia bacterium]|nr:hypothetical protein [Thermoanaerobaculia bacterium]